jgi:glucose/arabinose dehydrogenase
MKRGILLFLLLTALNIQAADLPDGFVEVLVADNLDPTDLLVAPDGRVFIVIKSGRILIVEDGRLLDDPFLNLENQVDNRNERGLGHMVLDPDFETNQYYYIYYTVKGQNRNRVSRFTATGNFTVPQSERVILNLNQLAGTIHNAGAMVFDKEGKLFIGTGEAADPSNSQSKNSLLGKILRINPDGSIPDDNPFMKDSTVFGVNRAIWALGFRNPYSMSIDPVTGKIYANDVGNVEYEEINEVLKGRNYGWPDIEGFRTNQTPPVNYQDPVYAYPHGFDINSGCAVVGSAFYSLEQYPPGSFPETYHGRYFFADYCGGYIRMIDPETEELIEEVFATGINRPLAIQIASDGSLYYLARAGIGGGSEEDNTSTDNGTLWRVTYTGSGEPFISVQPDNVLVPIGEDATFIVAASGNRPLSYQWERDHVVIPSATSSTYTIQNVQLEDDGTQFSCIVSNAVGNVTSETATLNVTVNTRPDEPAINVILPGNATFYQAGFKLIANGKATDPQDGELDASAFLWKIDFHHDNHTHPALGWTGGLDTIEYTLPIVGETSDNVWLRIYLRVTDSEGLSNTSYRPTGIEHET